MIRRRPVKHVRQYLSSAKIRKRRKQRRLFKLIALSIGISSFIILFFYINNLAIFQLKKVDISGNSTVLSEHIESETTQYLQNRTILFNLIPSTHTYFISTEALSNYLIKIFPRFEKVQVHRSLVGHINIEVFEKKPQALWCTDIKQMSCFDIDDTGHIFDKTQDTQKFNHFYVGIVGFSQIATTSSPIKFIEATQFHQSESFISQLQSIQINPKYIICNAELTCTAYIQNQSMGRIVFDLNSDLSRVIDRLKVALESSSLKGKPIAYIDTRFGNKLFYKQQKEEQKEVLATSSESVEEESVQQ